MTGDAGGSFFPTVRGAEREHAVGMNSARAGADRAPVCRLGGRSPGGVLYDRLWQILLQKSATEERDPRWRICKDVREPLSCRLLG